MPDPSFFDGMIGDIERRCRDSATTRSADCVRTHNRLFGYIDGRDAKAMRHCAQVERAHRDSPPTRDTTHSPPHLIELTPQRACARSGRRPGTFWTSYGLQCPLDSLNLSTNEREVAVACRPMTRARDAQENKHSREETHFATEVRYEFSSDQNGLAGVTCPDIPASGADAPAHSIMKINCARA
jgi:hypothetical protein